MASVVHEDFDKKAAEMVTKVVAAIVLDDPFYGYLLLRQEIKQDHATKTAMTDGKEIRYNPAFLRKQTISKAKGLFKHEVMHIAHLHHTRRNKRESRKWNRACDYVINALLIEAHVDLPDNGLMDPQYKDHSAEHVYNMLPDEPDDGTCDGTGGFGSDWNWGGVEDAPGSQDESIRKQVEEDTKLEVMQAVNAAKMMGKLPAGMERMIDEIAQSRMPWKHILARFFRSTAKNDYSWLRPNRRYIAHDMYLPSLHSDALGPIVIGVDTSGSVGTAELELFFGCINGILKQTHPESIHIVYCDAAVGSTQVFTPADLPLTIKKFKPSGGGGTDFNPVFDYVQNKHLNPCALLYLTDMYGSFPSKAPKYPTIWCATSQIKAPFGKTLEIK